MLTASELDSEVISYIEKSGQALGEAESLAHSVTAERTKIASITPAVAAEVQKLGLLEEHERSQFATKIASHEGAIGVVRKLASLLAESRRKLAQHDAVSPGQGIETPARQTEKRSCFVGSRVGLGQLDPAKYASEVALGLAPSE